MTPPCPAEKGPQVSTEALETRPVERMWLDRLVLVVVSGPDQGATAVSPGARMVVGTDPSCDFRLSDRAMSRFHCEIAIEDQGVTVRDMDSTNGTRLDGVRVRAAWLRRGSRLELGRNLLEVDLAGEPVGVELYPAERFGSLVGRSPAMRAAFARLERAAASDLTVLLTGETGTGKDLAAEAIHQASARATEAFAVVDCGGLPRGLLESELFGHARGAFTGAANDRRGVIEEAHHGTLFLDEIGELAPDLQPALLRILERREVRRVGETQWRPVDVRIIAATNRDLRRDVNTGRFRADLYYRLAVLHIQMPPLRERMEDLPLLIEHLVERVAGDDRELANRLRERVRADDLARRDFPGNVRELRNCVESCLIKEPRGEDEAGGRGGLAAPVPGAAKPFRVARESWLRWFERQYVQDLLARHGGNVSAAARAAGVGRTYIHRMIARSGLRR